VLADESLFGGDAIAQTGMDCPERVEGLGDGCGRVVDLRNGVVAASWVRRAGVLILDNCAYGFWLPV